MPQRRYTEEQLARVRDSGEKPADFSNDLVLMPKVLQRAQANVMAAVPRAVTDTLSLVGMVPAMVRAGLSSEVDLPDALYGKEGINEVSTYVQKETQNMLSQLPEERRTQKNMDAIVNAVRNSDPANEILNRHANALVKFGNEAGDKINNSVGLEPIRKETGVDELEQIVAGALVPIGGASKVVQSGMRRAVGSAIEMALPGTARYSVPHIAANVGVQEGISQGLRAATDQPSLITGDALGPETVTAHDVPLDADPEMGLNAEQVVGSTALIGGLITAGVVLSGKANRLGTKAALDAVDTIADLPGDGEKLKPTLTATQRAKSEFVDGSSPMRDTINNEYADTNEVARKSAIADVERTVTNSANANLNSSHKVALETGIIPGYDGKIMPLAQIERKLSQYAPEEVKLFEDRMLAETLLDRHALNIKSVEDDLRDRKLNIGNTGKQGVAEMQAIKAKLDELKSDAGKLEVGDMSAGQARALIAATDTNPRIMEARNMYRQFNDDLLKAGAQGGLQSEMSIKKLTAAHPNHMMLQEDPKVGKTMVGTWWDGLRGTFKGSEPQKMFGTVRGPLLGRDEKGPKVQTPMNALDAARHQLYDHIQFTVMNDATRTYVNALKQTPGWKKVIREVDSMTLDEFHAKGESKKLKNKENIFAYTDNGRVHYMETADKELHRALQFNAPSTVGVFNGMRKIYQSGTTGTFSPEFAPTAALFEDGIARMTRQPGRSNGIFDATLRRAFPDSTALSNALDKLGGTLLLPINTSQVQMLAGVFQQIGMHEIKDLSKKIANDLEAGTGFFNLMAKAPGGKQLLETVSESMIRSYNDSRYATFVNAGISQSNLLDDPLKSVRAGYSAVDYSISKAAMPLKHAWHSYKNTLESIHNSSKYAFFAQNLAALERKHGGRGKVPQAEIDKLAGEVKSMSGDMTRSVGNETFGKVLSAVPYGQIAVNSTYHLASAIKRDPTNVGMRIVSGHLAPKIAAIALVSASPASDWYWNEIPTWQRLSKIPVIGPSWWMDLANGNQRALTPDDVYLMADAPEMTFMTNPVITALRTMGVFGGEPQATSSFAKELGEGMESISSIATPPIISLITAGAAKVDLGRMLTSPLTGKPVLEENYVENPHQGFNTTGMNADSMFSRSFSNVITGLFGVSVGNVLNSVDTAKQSMDNGDNIGEAFDKAFLYTAYQAERRVTELPGTRELGLTMFTGGQRRQYASTARRENILGIMDRFAPVARQLSVEKDSSGNDARAEEAGLAGLRQIQDPKVADAARLVYDGLMKGKMKSLSSDRVDLNKDLVRIEANKERMSPATYHRVQTGIMEGLHSVDKQQSDLIKQLEFEVHHQYGATIDDVIDGVEASIGQPSH